MTTTPASVHVKPQTKVPAANNHVLAKLLNKKYCAEHGLTAVYTFAAVHYIKSYIDFHPLFHQDEQFDRVCRGLVRLYPGILQEFVHDLRSTDDSRKINAIRFLIVLGNRDKARTAIKLIMRNNDPKIRATLVSIMKTMVDLNDLTLMLDFFKDPDPRVKANVIEALEIIKSKSAICALLRHLNSDNNRIRANAMRALYSLGYTGIGDSLWEMMRSNDSRMRSSGVWVIGEIGRNNQETLKLLKLVKNDASTLVRKSLEKALKKINLPDVTRWFPRMPD